MIPTQNTWGTEALSWYSCWYSVTEAAMYFVLSWVGSRVGALISAQYPGLCCDKVPCHRRHPAICPDHLLISDRASAANTLIVTARPARTLVMRMMSGSIVHWCFKKFHPKIPNHGEGPSRGLLCDYEPSDAIRMQLFGALCPPRLSPRLSIRMTRTHIPRLVSLPCRCTTLLPGTLSKMSINKMTFNRKVKIGSLLTAWHRYLVIDLYITIPNLREAEREPSTHSAVYRPEKLLPIWEDKEGSGLGLPTNDCYGRSFDSIKHYKLTATQQQTFSQKWAAAFGRAADFLIQCWIYVFLFSGRGRNNVRITHQWSSARPPLGGELGD